MKSQIDKIVFKYLDNQDFIQIERKDEIYFVNSENDECAQIKFDNDDGWCYINSILIMEISNFFSLLDSEEIISKWVENTLQTKVRYFYVSDYFDNNSLRIPN